MSVTEGMCMTAQPEAGPGSGTKPSRGERTRRRLLESSRAVFERKGFLETRMIDIAAEANMAVGSIYNYFDSKEEMFREAVEEMVAGIFPPAGPASEGPMRDPISRIEATTRHFLEFYRSNAGMMTQFEAVATAIPEFHAMRAKVRFQTVERNRRAIVRMQEQGVVDRSLDPFVTASLLVAMTSNFTYTWFVLGQEFEPEEAVHHITILWARALGLDHHYPEPEAGATAVPIRGTDAGRSRHEVGSKGAASGAPARAGGS